MRKLLLLALFLYNIVATLAKEPFEYDDGAEALKRHSMMDDRRNWRKKALLKPSDVDRKFYDGHRKRDFENRYGEDGGDQSAGYRGQRRYDEGPGPGFSQNAKSAEMRHSYPDNQTDKKIIPMNCDRPHERYEACFAGCAAVSCDNPRDRMRPCYPFCESGCVCVHPYIRDDRTHKCVLPDECTKGLQGIPDLGEDV